MCTRPRLLLSHDPGHNNSQHPSNEIRSKDTFSRATSADLRTVTRLSHHPQMLRTNPLSQTQYIVFSLILLLLMLVVFFIFHNWDKRISYYGCGQTGQDGSCIDLGGYNRANRQLARMRVVVGLTELGGRGIQVNLMMRNHSKCASRLNKNIGCRVPGRRCVRNGVGHEWADCIPGLPTLAAAAAAAARHLDREPFRVERVLCRFDVCGCRQGHDIGTAGTKYKRE
jgi:hypothetical protein